MARFAGLLLAAAGGISLWPRLLLLFLLLPILAQIWCSIVTLGTFSININNLKKYVYFYTQKIHKHSQNYKISTNWKKSEIRKKLNQSLLISFFLTLIFFFSKKRVLFLVWPFNDISIWPELSRENPGGNGLSVTDEGWTDEGRRTLCLILYI